MFYQIHGDFQTALKESRKVLQLAEELNLPDFKISGAIVNGWAQVNIGNAQEKEAGLEKVAQGVSTWINMGVGMNRTHNLAILAQALYAAGQYQEGLEKLDQAMTYVEQSSECYYEAEIHRLRGVIELNQGADDNIVEFASNMQSK